MDADYAMPPDEIKNLIERVRTDIQTEMQAMRDGLQAQIETIDTRTKAWYEQLNRTFKLLLDLNTEDYKARKMREAEQDQERSRRQAALDRSLLILRWVSIGVAIYLAIFTLLWLGSRLASVFQ